MAENASEVNMEVLQARLLMKYKNFEEAQNHWRKKMLPMGWSIIDQYGSDGYFIVEYLFKFD